MEELIGFLPMIIIIVITAVANANKNKQKAQQHPYDAGSARPPVTRPVPTASSIPVSMASMLPSQPEGGMAPSVHPHLAPDCNTHDAPSMGSLGVTSLEGKDPCHEEQLPHTREALPQAPEAQPALTLDWSGEAMVKAFVMHEVLTRPCDRRR